MLPGIQALFNGRVPLETLGELRQLGWRVARIETHNSDEALIRQMIADVVACDLIPYTIIWLPDDVRHIPRGQDAECTNELDGDIDPQEYRRLLNECSAVAQECGVRLWAPTISNLDDNSFKWMNDVKGDVWPVGMYGVSVHRYGDGLFDTPHPGFKSRASEKKWLDASRGNLPYVVSEVGYPTMENITETHQAECLIKELQFFHDAEYVIVYQLWDGPDPQSKDRLDHYGIRRRDPATDTWHWKPAAYILQQQPVEGEYMNSALMAVPKEDLIAQGENRYACWWPHDSDTVLSVQPDGTYETRPNTAIGPWETAELKENKLIYTVDGKTYVVIVV